MVPRHWDLRGKINFTSFAQTEFRGALEKMKLLFVYPQHLHCENKIFYLAKVGKDRCENLSTKSANKFEFGFESGNR